ncbi:unnamed protein product [Caenorhabditis angaria]|uniref:Uncharacterized protein n=1 Tax=Caenorhabditis angaria TaxID=860376 RepID=A0A9P1MXV4_9PELO|nr:unnamed protein product [Caenorhabditis angaria]
MGSPEAKRRKLENEPIGWFDLPEKPRKIIIDAMHPKTRCIFTICSKKCEEEAKLSVNFMYEISVEGERKEKKLKIKHQTTGWNCDYQLEFVENKKKKKNDSNSNPSLGPQTKVIYKKDIYKAAVKWEKIENGTPDAVRLKYFLDYFQKYEKSLKKLEINDKSISLSSFNIKNCTNLEKITARHGDVFKSDFMTFEQVKTIKDVDISGTPLTIDQFKKLEGKSYGIMSDEFTEKKLNDYLRLLKKGEIHRNMEFVCILFDKRKRRLMDGKVMEGLDVYDQWVKRDGKHYNNMELDYKNEEGKKLNTEVLLQQCSITIQTDPK